jgi:hypothetical protein
MRLKFAAQVKEKVLKHKTKVFSDL